MGLNKLISSSLLRRHSWFIILALFMFILAGCGESEEVVIEESQEAAEETSSDQALTNFIGADTDVSSTGSSATKIAQYEKLVQDLRTENTSLKQNIVKLEQENRSMNARLTELNAKYMSEKFRADSTEMLAKGASMAPKAKAVIDKDDYLPPSESTYDYAMDQFRARRYDSAVKGFKAIVEGGGQDELVGRSKYWLGESYFAQKNYRNALPLFLNVLKMKSSVKKADAQYMLGRTYENLGNKAKAKAAYEKVVKNYPMSRNVKSAKARWARL